MTTIKKLPSDFYIHHDKFQELSDEAIDYFLDIVLDLKALKRLSEPPTDLFLQVESDVRVPDNFWDTMTITLTNL